ncbi:hypothetical protein MH117_09940 [Paenibacillus sp. ACRRX]|uniref:hypothetical protein n=1 Tax=Paenibacillus sp. ACRRX TaxID=2918206 RepID=UPI001EF538E5|nr:hypothetical protein [Paenibacillus sp. ACRRX]MCG7407744.1 hypothetical protein [Paenibacillus sp. ACRRX]
MFLLSQKKQEQVSVEQLMEQMTERFDMFLATVEKMITEKEERSIKAITELIAVNQTKQTNVKGFAANEVKLTLNEARLAGKTSRFEGMTKCKLRDEVSRILREIEVIRGIDRRKVYRELYEELRQRNGFDYHKVKATKKYKKHATKLDALIDKGHGKDLAEIAVEMFEKRK